MKESKMKEQQGITLVALAVTILVLLVLAGISVNMIIGDNGILTKALEAKKQTEEDQVNSETRRNILSDELTNWMTKANNTGNTIAPSVIAVNLNGYSEGSWINSDIKVTLSGANIGTYQYSADDGASWTDCSSSVEITEDVNSNYKFRIISNGEALSTSKSYNIKRDTTAPIIEAKTRRSGNEVTVTVTKTTENGSGISDYEYYYKLTSDDDSAYKKVENESGTSCEIDLGSWSSYMIKIVATDLAGNKGECKVSAGTGCFVAGTQVLTVDGMKNIEDIQIGDKVYAIDLETNKREIKEVINLFRGKSDETYDITIGNETITATPRHEFYIVDKGWVRAYDLEEGDQIEGKDSDEYRINKIVHNKLEEPISVYNLTIEGLHNYLITKYELLVHNAVNSPTKD